MPFQPAYIMGIRELFGDKPIYELLRKGEEHKGHFVIRPGQKDWLPADDWDETSVVSQDGKEVRLVAILAKRSSNGAFKRLLGAIKEAGLKPVVVCPMPDIEIMLRAFGWRYQQHRPAGDALLEEEHWRPPDNFGMT